MKLKIVETNNFRQEYIYINKCNPKLSEKINRLILDVVQHPDYGIGKPEKLKYCRSGTWSRRIDQKNRLIYYVDADNVIFLHCCGHYGDR